MPVQSDVVLSVDALMAAARAETGIEIVDVEAVEPLGALVDSLNAESGLHAAGRKGMAGKIIRMLSNRLRMQRDFRAHPEIADQVVNAPIFFCGMGRTGSTKAQKLLAMSGEFNWLSYWRALNPSLITGDRTESPQARIDDADEFTRWFDQSSPDLKYAHSFETHEPEEESLILEHSLRSPTWLGWAPIDGYLAWLMGQDQTAQFRYLRDTLKYLQWQGIADPDKRWVLKSPLYTGMEPSLLDVFPDARLIMTHREPARTIPSALRLMELFHKPFTDRLSSTENYLRGQIAGIDAHLAHRARPEGLDVLDLDFREITGAPEKMIRRVFDYIGKPLSSEALARMMRWNDDNPQHKHGKKHVYALEDYGLSEAQINEMFAGYRQLMKDRLATADR